MNVTTALKTESNLVGLVQICEYKVCFYGAILVSRRTVVRVATARFQQGQRRACVSG